MPQEILIHITPNYIQVACIEDNQVQEIDMEAHEVSLRVHDIYYGKIVRILPDMQMAFVEIGAERTALLHFTDIVLPDTHGYTDVGQFLRVGQLLPVQINKLPLRDKGAVVSGRIQLIGGLVIYQPFGKGIKVAKRIVETEERNRLYDIIKDLGEVKGVMVRSLAEGHSPEAIVKELHLLQSRWEHIQTLMQEGKKPRLLNAEQNLAYTFIRERVSANTQKIYVDNAEFYEQLKSQMSVGLQIGLPQLQKVSEKKSPWNLYKVEQKIKEALSSKVTLPSGGDIVIERTESMTVVDVNTGPYVKSAAKDIMLQTNKEAANEIARQLRIRNISGNIVVDFIRMQKNEQQQEVLNILHTALVSDHIQTQVYGFSLLGLVEMSRARRGNSWVEFYHE